MSERQQSQRTRRTTPRSALIDSSAFYALADPTDAHNVAAKEIAPRLHRERWQLFTTNFIRAEAHALILNRLSHRAADRFLQELQESPSATIIRITEADEEAALELIARYQDKDFSLTDAISFVVMERLGIPSAFAFDRNFTQYGLPVLEARGRPGSRR
jgi:predicted nucleic acid-binding protein